MSNPTPPSLPPGFRFHPTDEELILHYLRNRASSRPCPVSIIADIDIYKFDPWDLPAKAMFGEREWYFFTPRDRKYPNGVRPNRSAASGYWKATGTDKPVLASGKDSRSIGVKKALVFYKGKAPKGRKTDWIMHEYRLTGAQRRQEMKPVNFRDYSMRLDDWVLCRIYNKCSKLPIVDLEQEDSGGEYVYLPNLPISCTQKTSVMLHNSSSLSDLLDTVDYSLLSRLLDDQTEDINTSVSTTERDLQRQRMMDAVSNQEYEDFVHPLKKQGSSCTVSNYTNNLQVHTMNLKNSLLDQPLFHHQMMMYSHFGLH